MRSVGDDVVRGREGEQKIVRDLLRIALARAIEVERPGVRDRIAHQIIVELPLDAANQAHRCPAHNRKARPMNCAEV